MSDHCTECGMANVGEEYHPQVLCRLVKARGGDTTKARSDMAFVLRAARASDPWTSERITTFLTNQAKEATK